MPFYKYSFVCNYVSGTLGGNWDNTPGGWSESVYAADITDATRTRFRTLANRRAALMGDFTKITGLRIQQVDPNGPAATVRVNLGGVGGAGEEQDMPQVGVLLSIPSQTTTNVRRHRLAAMIDASIKRGEWSPSPAQRAAMQQYIQGLHGWLMRGLDLTQPRISLKLIDALGNYETVSDIPLAIGHRVKVMNVIKADGKKLSKEFEVESVATLRTGKLRNWTFGLSTLGTIRRAIYIFPAMNTVAFEQAAISTIVRKIGRPTKKYVGRRSKRRS